MRHIALREHEPRPVKSPTLDSHVDATLALPTRAASAAQATPPSAVRRAGEDVGLAENLLEVCSHVFKGCPTTQADGQDLEKLGLIEPKAENSPANIDLIEWVLELNNVVRMSAIIHSHFRARVPIEYLLLHHADVKAEERPALVASRCLAALV